mgnify:CR=1 FL=1
MLRADGKQYPGFPARMRDKIQVAAALADLDLALAKAKYAEAIDAVEPAAAYVDRLVAEYEAARARL